MYVPDQFRCEDRALALALMREHPLATLVSLDQQGQPYLSHLPMLAQEADDQVWLLGHLARSNPHADHLRHHTGVVVSFLGPHAYLSPTVYPDLRRVPTWNYVTVVVRGEVQLMDDPQEKDHLLKQLIDAHEPSYAAQWRGLEGNFQQAMLRGVVGFRLRAQALDLKLKLNQHRPEAHARMIEGYEQGGELARGVARWMRRIGLAPMAAAAPANDDANDANDVRLAGHGEGAT